MGGSRIAHTLAFALVALLGCTRGGQSSDDGAPLDDGGGDGGTLYPPDSGPPPPDAGMHEHIIVVEAVLGGGPFVVACGAGFTAAQVAVDATEAILNAPQHCRGNGGFDCECDGELVRSEAFSCEAALFQACGVAAEAIDGSGVLAVAPASCDSQSSAAPGRCTQVTDGSYYCMCGVGELGPPFGEPLDEEPNPASCELALFRSCQTGPCESQFGACDADDDTIGGYACTCSTNGFSRSMVGRDCSDALMRACSPHYDLEDHCSGYGGYCVNTDPVALSSLHCTCADGTEHDVEHTSIWDDIRVRGCREDLERTCGLGSPPEGAQCLGEGNGHLARCTRGPSNEEALLCECYLAHGVMYVSEFGMVEGETCDRDVLESFCPKIAPLPEDAAETACDHYIGCERPIIGLEREACIADVDDACAACVIGERIRLNTVADGCPAERIQCYEACASIVPRETGIAACEQKLEELELVTPEASCLCDRCHPAFGNCIADEGCREILDCATTHGCTDATCPSHPVCGPLIAQSQGTPSFTLIVNFSSCEQKDSCRE
jgi:hypothetical protein